jgi:hypothetical protein
LVRCEAAVEKDMEVVNGMENSVHGVFDGDDGEVAYFPGAANQRATEDIKRMKLCSGKISAGHAGGWVLQS